MAGIAVIAGLVALLWAYRTRERGGLVLFAAGMLAVSGVGGGAGLIWGLASELWQLQRGARTAGVVLERRVERPGRYATDVYLKVEVDPEDAPALAPRGRGILVGHFDGDYGDFEPGYRVEVVYDPRRPDRWLLAGARGWGSYLVSSLIAILVLLVGAGGAAWLGTYLRARGRAGEDTDG